MSLRVEPRSSVAPKRKDSETVELAKHKASLNSVVAIVCIVQAYPKPETRFVS